jgi:hypothetical protein
MNDKQVAWYQNKIKGGVAEAACRAHFEALGYTVESTGIEHIAPGYCTYSGDHGYGNYIQSYMKSLQRMPDFLASRTYADTTINRNKGLVGKKDAIFLEVKYRESFTEALTEELYQTYKQLIDNGMSIVVYLVTKEDVGVRLNFFCKELYSTRPCHDSNWSIAGHSLFESLPIYQGQDDEHHFNWVHTHVIRPSLATLFYSSAV